MSADIEIDDVEDALRRADELAELTGRAKKDIIADLLDDGQLNLSAGEDSEKKDLLDRAQEQAEKLKSLLTTLIPVFALIMSIGAEGLGIVDITGWGSDSMWDDDNHDPNLQVMWGCMNSHAVNYDETANQDDGSCEFEPPPCVNSWLYEDNSHKDENRIIIEFTFYDGHDCGTEIDGHFIITLYSNGAQIDDAFVNVGHFTDSVDVNYEFTDLDTGTYNVSIQLHELACETGTCEHADEWTMEQNPTFTLEDEDDDCMPNLNYYDLNLGADANSLTLYVDFQDGNGCEETDLEMRIELFWNGESYHFMDWGTHGGLEPISDSEVNYEIQEEFMTGLNDGDWYMEWASRVVNNDNSDFEVEEQTNTVTIDEIPDECADDDEDGVCNEDEVAGCTDENAENYDTTATDDDGSCEYPPEYCEINLWNIEIDSNATHAWIVYDLDCGYEDNDLDGYNVSVQFLIYRVNETNSGPNATGPLNWTTDLHYIEGWESDAQYMMLSDFAQNNTTHYDFYFYAIWEDGDGENQLIEHKWLNRELDA